MAGNIPLDKILERLATNDPSVTYLSFSPMDDMEAFAQVLKINSTLTHLDLCGNDIRLKGIDLFTMLYPNMLDN
jgi:hypothetical protein